MCNHNNGEELHNHCLVLEQSVKRDYVFPRPNPPVQNAQGYYSYIYKNLLRNQWVPNSLDPDNV